ncbi:glycosyltransferase [Flavobacteriaceae bacterium TK19130]|nr:glycosyltransferase [Thermobacterium salinum]
MKYVLVVDWLDKYGGAERVIKSLARVFPVEKCYALVDIMQQHDIEKMFRDKQLVVETTTLQKLGKRFRIFFPFFDYFSKKISIDKDTDIIISSSHAVAKGVRKTASSQLHFSYFQARNQKYLWEDATLYFKLPSIALKPLLTYLRRLDVQAAQQPDYIISNSKFVQRWVKNTYKRDSAVIYPPVELEKFKLNTNKEDYYIAVGRMEPYKRFDIIVEAFRNSEKKLIIVGDGSQLPKLKKHATDNISFTGYLESERICDLIGKARAFIHAGVEDFGIAPIEAQSCGTPIIAYGYGGVLETVLENKTGIFFYEKNSNSLLEALSTFETLNFNYSFISEHAQQFSTEKFEDNLQKFVSEKIKTNKS